MTKVIVELRVSNLDMSLVMDLVHMCEEYGFESDEEWRAILPTEERISLTQEPTEGTVCIRGEIPEEKIEELKQAPNVENVWIDAKIAPFNSGTGLELTQACEPYDCEHRTAKGDLDAEKCLPILTAGLQARFINLGRTQAVMGLCVHMTQYIYVQTRRYMILEY
jgi:hypothetical protein